MFIYSYIQSSKNSDITILVFEVENIDSTQRTAYVKCGDIALNMSLDETNIITNSQFNGISLDYFKSLSNTQIDKIRKQK